MRNEVDATEMDDVYLEQSEEDFTDATAPVSAPASPVVVETTATIVTPPSSEKPESPPT